jgi:hypothetical protein
MKKELIKFKQEEYQMITIFMLYIIILTIFSFGLIGVLLIYFKDNSYILITGTLLVLSFAFYKLNKFHSLFYEYSKLL